MLHCVVKVDAGQYELHNEMPFLLSALGEERNEVARDYLYLSLFTGARKTNVLQMRWEQIDWHNKTWRIPDTKNGEPVVIPLSGKAEEILEGRLKFSNANPWVLPSETSKSGHLTLSIFTPDCQDLTDHIPDIGMPTGRLEIDELVNAVDPKVVFIDNISTFIRTGNENEGDSWTEAGLSTDAEAAVTAQPDFQVTPQPDIIATLDEVLAALEGSEIKLLDNRDKIEWVAKSSSPYGVDYAPRKGRLPD